MQDQDVLEPLTDQNSETASFRGVIMPHHPATDEICAAVIFERIQKIDKAEIRFWGHPDCPAEKLEGFLVDGYLPIEIGDMRRETIGASSAACAVTQHLNYFDLTVGEFKLLEMLARRNRDGYMNQFYMSLPRILRNLYEILGYDEADLIDRFKDVVRAFLNYEDRPEDSPASQIPSELMDLAEETKRCQSAPFTPGRYLRDLCYRGDAPDQIREKVSFWVNAWNRFQEEYVGAKTEWSEMQKLRFSYGQGLRAAAITTTNRFVSKVIFGQNDLDLVIVRSAARGNTAIMLNSKTRVNNVSALYAELGRLEPGKWYRHKPAGNLLNGGPHFPDIEATSLTLEELVATVQRFPPG